MVVYTEYLRNITAWVHVDLMHIMYLGSSRDKIPSRVINIMYCWRWNEDRSSKTS
jgi:hypothetical protein